MVAIATKPPKIASKRKVPDFLVKEEIDGVRFYYKNYKDVLNKKKNVEEIMGSSAIQSLVIEYLMAVFIEGGLRKKYRIFTNETGNNLGHRNNLQFDIALYDRTLLTADKITDKYVNAIAPTIVLEIDTDVSLDDTGFTAIQDYYFTKTRKLIEYGTQKVIWIFTKGQKIMVAEGKDWHIYDFDKTIQVIDNVEFNLDEFLKMEKINL
jgi:hypothetical protein